MLVRRIMRILKRPCTPRMIAKLLRIESHERARWTRDGRLKPVGKVGARNGNPAACPTYSTDDILALIRHPETIEQWRRADADSDSRYGRLR